MAFFQQNARDRLKKGVHVLRGCPCRGEAEQTRRNKRRVGRKRRGDIGSHNWAHACPHKSEATR